MRKLVKLSLLAWIAALLPGNLAHAVDRPMSTTRTKAKPGVLVADDPTFSADILGIMQSNFRDPAEPEHVSEMILELLPTVRLSEGFALDGKIIIEQPVSGKTDTKVDDGIFLLRYRRIPLAAESRFSFVPQGGLVVPLSSDSVDKQSLRMGVTARPRLIWTAELFRAFYELQYHAYFHEFESSLSGEPNVANQLAHRFSAAYQLLPGFTLSSELKFTSSWTYQGDQHDSFTVLGELGYQFTKMFSASVGLENAAGMLAADGRSSNLSVFDNKSAVWYFYGALSI